MLKTVGHDPPRRGKNRDGFKKSPAALLGFFIITLDALGGGITGLQWVMDGYTLPFAALLLLAGTLADRVGARLAFGIGLVAFIARSAERRRLRPLAHAWPAWATTAA